MSCSERAIASRGIRERLVFFERPEPKSFQLTRRQSVMTLGALSSRIGSALEACACRLGRDCRLPADYAPAGSLFSSPFGTEYGRLFRFGPRRDLVAGRHFDGCDDLRGRYAAGRDGSCLHARNRRELVVVELSAVGDDDRIPVRAAVAAVGLAYRRAVCRVALRGKTGGVSPRVSRHISGL